MSNSAENMYSRLLEEEKELEFASFSRTDALAVGLKIVENAKKYPDPIAVEITVNGLVIFRYFTEGARADSALWLKRKRNSIELMSMSSLRFKYWLEQKGAALEERKINPDDYAAGGGGFPITVSGTGIIGSICISGLPNHLDDHALIVESLKQLR